MPLLVNNQTGLPESLLHTDAGQAYLSGTHSLLKGQAVHMTAPNGDMMAVDPGDVQGALQDHGYQFASPEAVKESQLQTKYGEGLGNEAASAALGAANTLSFGAATPALQFAGVDPEALEQIPQRNPISHIAGSIGSALLPIEAAPSLIARAGKGASESLLKALPQATSFAGKLAAKTAAGVAGGAVEGALYGAGDALSESTLGNPNYTAERVAAQVGLSGLLGGAIGGALGLGGVALPAAYGKAKEALTDVLEGKGGQAVENAFVKGSAFVSGKSVEDIRTALANRGFDNNPSTVRKFAEDLTGSLQSHYEAMESLMSKASSDLRPEESAALVKNMDPAPIYAKLTKVEENLQEAIQHMESRPELYPARYPSKLKEATAAFTRDIVEGNSSEAGFKALDDLKSNLDKEIKFGKVPSDETMDAKSLFGNLRKGIKESLEDESVFGEAGARQAEYNDSISNLLKFQNSRKSTEFQTRFMRRSTGPGGRPTYKVDPVRVNRFLNQMDDVRGASDSTLLDGYLSQSKEFIDKVEKGYLNLPNKEFDAQPLKEMLQKTYGVQADFEGHASVKRAFDRLQKGPGSPTGATAAVAIAKTVGVPYSVAAPAVGLYEILSNPGAAIQRLAKLEAVVSKVSKTIESKSKSLFQAAKPGLERATSGITGAGSAAASRSTFDSRVKEINSHANNSEALGEKLEKISAGMADHAPQTAMALQQTAIRGVQFLQGKVPQAPSTYPLQATWQPGAADMAKFNRYYQTVEKPLSVLDHIKSNTLTHENMEAIQAVYPQLHQEIQKQVINAMADKGNKMPYSTRVQLSLFLGQDLTASTHSASILSNQVALSGGSQQQGMQPPPQKKVPVGAKMNSSQRFLTPMQMSAQRGAK